MASCRCRTSGPGGQEITEIPCQRAGAVEVQSHVKMRVNILTVRELILAGSPGISQEFLIFNREHPYAAVWFCPIGSVKSDA